MSKHPAFAPETQEIKTNPTTQSRLVEDVHEGGDAHDGTDATSSLAPTHTRQTDPEKASLPSALFALLTLSAGELALRSWTSPQATVFQGN